MTILAAIGGEYAQDRVVTVGHDLATAYDDELVVVHVMSREQFEDIRGSDDITTPVVISSADDTGLVYVNSKRASEYNLEEATEDANIVAEDCVENTLSADQRSIVRTEGRVGDPATEVIEEADRVDARFIVVGGRKRSPVGKAVFGSVSQSVILDSERPVVTITRKE